MTRQLVLKFYYRTNIPLNLQLYSDIGGDRSSEIKMMDLNRQVFRGYKEIMFSKLGHPKPSKTGFRVAQ